jgi:GNAT superfamily N-acetyltransferase
MPDIDITIETPISRSARARQLEGIFDVPPSEKTRLSWKAQLPIEELDWNVGLIVGPSGSGKTTIARELFGKLLDIRLKWGGASIIDDFDKSLSMEDIAAVCQAVGFNTIPAWLRPYKVLSNGERFRVELARRLLEGGDLIVFDEFTSVVDRQVARIGAHAVQKFVRRNGTRFVAVSCHADIIDWLQPDWVFEPANARFSRRRLRRRPKLECTISPVPYAAWRLFAPYHYLTADLNRAARCFGLFVGSTLAAFAGMLTRPHAIARNIMGCSRLVTLPDFQGLGLAFVLLEAVAGLYVAQGKSVHMYPAHPSLIRSFDRSPHWQLRKMPGIKGVSLGPRSNQRHKGGLGTTNRPCAVFRYVGPAAEREEAERVFEYWGRPAPKGANGRRR